MLGLLRTEQNVIHITVEKNSAGCLLQRDELREVAEAGNTPFHLATKKKNYTMARRLLESSCCLDLGATNKDGFTASDMLDMSRETAPKEFTVIFSTLIDTSLFFFLVNIS